MSYLNNIATAAGLTAEQAVEVVNAAWAKRFVGTFAEVNAEGIAVCTLTRPSNRDWAIVEAAIEAARRPIAKAAAVTAQTPSHRCYFCGGTWAATLVHDMSGIPGYVCGHHVADFTDGLGNFS